MTFLEILDLCKRSYTITNDDREVSIAGTTMTIEDREISGGFAAYKVHKPGKWTALVFRGSDDWRDWVLNNAPGAVLPVPPPQYGEVLTVAATVSPNLFRYGKDVWIESNASGPINKHGLDQIKI